MFGKMSIRERMLAVYNNQMPDKFPVAIYSRYFPRGSIERELRAKGLGIIEYYPLVTFLGPPWHNNPGFISQIKNTDIRVDYVWDKGDIIERRSYETPVGTVWQEKGRSVGAGSEYIKKHYITDIEDYKIMTYIMENTIIKSNESEILERKLALGEDGVLFGRMDRSPYQKLLIELVGAERFLVDLYTNIEVIEELFEIMHLKMQESFDIALDSCVSLIWQPDNVTSDMTPPKFFEQYLLPFYLEFGEKTKKSGKRYVAHFDGKIRALSELIKTTNIDVIESLSLPIIGGDMEFLDARRVFQGKVVIPNFPSNISTKKKEEIIAFLRDLKDTVGNKEPFMLQVSEDLAEGEWARVLPIIVSEMCQ
jgi:hypothetical protein